MMERPRDLPAVAQIESVPFIAQTENYCGPAALAMTFSHAGLQVPVEQLGREVFTPGKKGTLQMDMISAARRNGVTAIEVSGVPEVLREVAAGNPVIVLENLGLSWYPKWHYAVVTGFDLKNRDIIQHSGKEANKRWDLERFENAWRLGEYWGLVILPPGRLAKSAGETAHLKAAAGLELAGRAREAGLSYQAMLTAWPASLGARIGLANLAFKAGDSKSAVGWLRQAVKDHPSSEIAAHNLAVAEATLKDRNSSAR